MADIAAPAAAASSSSWFLDGPEAEAAEGKRYLTNEHLQAMEIEQQGGAGAGVDAGYADADDDPNGGLADAPENDGIGDAAAKHRAEAAAAARDRHRPAPVNGSALGVAARAYGLGPEAALPQIVGSAPFARTAISLPVLLGLMSSNVTQSLQLFIPASAVDGSKRLGLFKQNDLIAHALRGLYLVFTTLAQMHTSILSLGYDYAERNPTEASREAEQSAAPDVLAGGGLGVGAPAGAAARPPAKPQAATAKAVPYHEYNSHLKAMLPHQVCYLETVFAAGSNEGSSLAAGAAAAAAALSSGAYPQEQQQAAGEASPPAPANPTAVPNLNSVIGWNFVLLPASNEALLHRGISMLCAYFADAVSGRHPPKPSAQEAQLRAVVAALVETFKREHLSVDNIHSTLAYWLLAYVDYVGGLERKHSLLDLAAMLNINRPANGEVQLADVLRSMLSPEMSMRARLGVAYITMGQTDELVRATRPALLDAAQLAQARKLVWSPQARLDTYLKPGDAAMTSEFLRLAFNPLPLDTTTAHRLESYYFPNANIDSALTRCGAAAAADGTEAHPERALYEEITDGVNANLSIDDSLEAARRNWSWCALEDKLRRENDASMEEQLRTQQQVAAAQEKVAAAPHDATAKADLARAEAALDDVFATRARRARQSLDEIMHNLADTNNGCTGAQRLSEHFSRFQQAVGMEYGDPDWHNGCNLWGMLDPKQSFFQNMIQRRMIQVDKIFRRVNSHIPFFKAELTRTSAYDLTPGALRMCVYLDGLSGAGKTDLIDLIIASMVSADRVQYETDKALTTEAIDAMCCRAMSEMTAKYAGMGPDGVDPVMKEALSSGFVSVRTFHQVDKDPTRRLRATGSLFLVSMIAAGITSYEAFPPEVRQRWMRVLVSAVQPHPEAPTHELKDNAVQKDDRAYAKTVQEFRDENAWCALAMLVIQTGVGGHRWNLEISNAMVNAWNRAGLKHAHYVKLEARKKAQLIAAVKHWSLVHAVQFHLNGPGALVTGRYNQPFSKDWVLDVAEMASCPNAEVVWFVLGLYADDILDLRLTNVLSRLLPACNAPVPLDWANLALVDESVSVDHRPQYMETGGGKINYNYQRVQMPITAALTLMERLCHGEYTYDELRSMIYPDMPSFGHARPSYSTLGGGMHVPTSVRLYVRERDENGRYKMQYNPSTQETEHSYISGAPVIVKSGGGGGGGGGGASGTTQCFYVLTELHNDVHRALFLETLNATCNVFTKPRNYKITLGMPMVNESGRPWPNAFQTMRMQPNNTMPRAYCPFGLDPRSYHATYKNIGQTAFLAEVEQRQSTGTAIDGELELLALQRHVQRLHSPADAANRPLYGYWRYQVELQTYLTTPLPLDLASKEDSFMRSLRHEFNVWSYLTDADVTDPDTGLRDLGFWTATCIRASRERYEQVLNQEREQLDKKPVDRGDKIWDAINTTEAMAKALSLSRSRTQALEQRVKLEDSASAVDAAAARSAEEAAIAEIQEQRGGGFKKPGAPAAAAARKKRVERPVVPVQSGMQSLLEAQASKLHEHRLALKAAAEGRRKLQLEIEKATAAAADATAAAKVATDALAVAKAAADEQARAVYQATADAMAKSELARQSAVTAAATAASAVAAGHARQLCNVDAAADAERRRKVASSTLLGVHYGDYDSFPTPTPPSKTAKTTGDSASSAPFDPDAAVAADDAGSVTNSTLAALARTAAALERATPRRHHHQRPMETTQTQPQPPPPLTPPPPLPRQSQRQTVTMAATPPPVAAAAAHFAPASPLRPSLMSQLPPMGPSSRAAPTSTAATQQSHLLGRLPPSSSTVVSLSAAGPGPVRRSHNPAMPAQAPGGAFVFGREHQ